MQSLERWFAWAAARQERAVYLEDALLSGRFFAYAVYRLRYFLGRSVVAAILHIIEFTILAFIFSEHTLVSALMIRTVSNFLSAWWWGALESMRGQLRSLRREGKTHLIAKHILPWFHLAAVCSVFIMALVIGWMLLDTNRPTREFEVFHLYVFAIGLGLSLSILSRTYHSVVYAIRRIYRPFFAIIGIQLLGFLGTILIWPAFGVWSFPLMLIPVAVLANTLTFIYVRRVYRFLGLQPIRLAFDRGIISGLRRTQSREFYLAGFSYAFMRFDDLLVLSLFYGAYRNPNEYQLFMFFYLIGPFIRAAYEWAQLFYFDLKRLELELFLKLKERFNKLVRRVASVMGWLFWALASICGTLLMQRNLGMLYLLLVLFFLIRSHLAFYQIRAFAEQRYGVLMVTGLSVVMSLFLIQSAIPRETERFALYIPILLFALFCLGPACMAALRSKSKARILSLPDWLTRLNSLSQPVRVRSVCIGGNVENWLVEQIARQILQSIRTAGAMTIIGNRRITWYEIKSPGNTPNDALLLQYGAGLVDRLQCTPYAKNGFDALAAAQQEGLLGGLVSKQWPLRSRPYRIAEIKQRFRTLFPDGVLFDAARRDPTHLGASSCVQHREIMYGAIQYSKSLFRRIQKARFEVTTLFAGGEIRLIFGIPQSEPRKARSNWRSFINATNVCCALGAPITDEDGTMFPTILKRMLFWAIALTLVAAIWAIPMDDHASGSFQLRPALRAEVRAPVEGFLGTVNYDEGDQVTSGSTLAWLEVPNLTSLIAQKRAEIEEVNALLRLLEAGTRPEVLAEQRARIERAQAWYHRASLDMKQAIQEDVQRIADKIDGYYAELKFARENYNRAKKLFKINAIHDREFRQLEKEYQVVHSQYQQAHAEQRAREALVILQAQSELIEREQDLADAQSTLTLMEAGSRPEKIDAERARLTRLNEELSYLEKIKAKLELYSPADGMITTSRLAEKVGQYYREGDLILEVADPTVLEAEIALPEQEVGRIKPGQRILLKARALPYQTFQAQVDRIAPVVEAGELQSTVKVYCQLKESPTGLRPGMSGYARIYLERRSAGSIFLDGIMRFIRTEFWW